MFQSVTYFKCTHSTNEVFASTIEIKNVDSDEVTRRANQMRNHLIQVEMSPLDIWVEQRQVTPLVECAQLSIGFSEISLS